MCIEQGLESVEVKGFGEEGMADPQRGAVVTAHDGDVDAPLRQPIGQRASILVVKVPVDQRESYLRKSRYFEYFPSVSTRPDTTAEPCQHFGQHGTEVIIIVDDQDHRNGIV